MKALTLDRYDQPQEISKDKTRCVGSCGANGLSSAFGARRGEFNPRRSVTFHIIGPCDLRRQYSPVRPATLNNTQSCAVKLVLCRYSTVGCRRTGGRRSQPGSFLFFTTPANLILIFQSVFESRRLACSAHTVCDDARHRSGVVSKSAMPRKNRLPSKRCLRVVKPFLTQFSSLGSFFFLDEIPAWPFFGKPFFGTRQYCTGCTLVTCIQ